MLPAGHGPRSRIGCGGAPGLDMSHKTAMTPTRLAAAQRHSPGSRPVRSSQDMFNLAEGKPG